MPFISAILPAGTSNTADESRKIMPTQLMPMVLMDSDFAISGSAIFMAAPIKGFINEVIITIQRRIVTFSTDESSFIIIGFL